MKGLAVALFLMWEGYWAYVFATAPVPDEKMSTVMAFLRGLILPLLVVS